MPVMTYNSMFFMLFFAVFLIVSLLMPRPAFRQLVIFAGNIFFYKFVGGLNALVLVAAASLILYLCTRRMEQIYKGFEAEAISLSKKEQAAQLPSYK